MHEHISDRQKRDPHLEMAGDTIDLHDGDCLFNELYCLPVVEVNSNKTLFYILNHGKCRRLGYLLRIYSINFFFLQLHISIHNQTIAMALRPSFLTVFLFLNAVCFCQHDLRRVNVSTLPEEISILKDVSNAIRWTDSTGDNVVVTTQKIYRPSDDIVLGS